MILKKILKLAEKNNISISCLEKTLGFGNGTIKKWGESSPSVDKLKKVADYFGVSVDYFWSRKRGKEDEHTGSSETGIRRKKIHRKRIIRKQDSIQRVED